MREQIHTWCEQTSFEQVGKRDVECLGWFEATALVPKRVIFLVGREVTGEERKQGEGGGDRAVPGPFKPMLLAVSLHHCLRLFFRSGDYSEILCPGFLYGSICFRSTLFNPCLRGTELGTRTERRGERDTQSFHSRIL